MVYCQRPLRECLGLGVLPLDTLEIGQHLTALRLVDMLAVEFFLVNRQRLPEQRFRLGILASPHRDPSQLGVAVREPAVLPLKSLRRLDRLSVHPLGLGVVSGVERLIPSLDD